MLNLLSTIKEQLKNSDGRSIKMYKNTAAMILIKGISILISLLSAPIMLHHVNRADYGILLTLTSVVSWIGCMDIGLGNGLRNTIPGMLARGDVYAAKKAVSSSYAALALYIALLIGAFLLICPHIDWLNVLNSPTSDASEIRNLARVVFIAFCVQFLLGLIYSILFAFQMPALQSFLTFSSQIFTFIALVIQVYVFKVSSVFQIGAVNCLMPPCVLLLGSIVLFNTKLKDVAPSFKLIELKSVSNILSLGVKFFVLQVITIILFQANNIIITRVVGPESVVEYSMAFKYISVLTMVFNIIITPIWSATTDAYVRSDFTWIRKTLKVSKKICYLTITIGLIMTIFSKFAYSLWLGNSSIYISYTTTGLVFLSISFELLYKVYGTIINGTGKVYAQMVITSFIAICYIPLALILGRLIGLPGVLIANSIVFLLNYIWSKIQCKKLIVPESTSKNSFWYK